MAIPGPSETRRITLAGRTGTEITLQSFSISVVDGPDTGKSARLTSTSLRIGTEASCDLVLADPAVSRRHAVVTLSGDGLLVEDLESKNGTWLGGARVRAVLVADGATVQVGSNTLSIARAPRRIVAMSGEVASLPGLLGRSAQMLDLFALIEQLALTDIPVAVRGETGTGKELVSRALHLAGPRCKRPFVVLDCGAVVEDLLRSELFGHEKGAFTGAEQQHRGVLEQADGGTVMLDEIGEMKPSVQPHLLRALETREITRMGGSQKIGVDFRIVSATNCDLAQMVADGRFRQDLYYRLSGVPLLVPPLRERRDDIELLARAFLESGALRNRAPVPELSAAALEVLLAHPWPGNVRELRNLMESACALSRGNPILPELVKRLLVPGAPVIAATTATAAPVTLEEAEREAIERALEATGWNRTAAARRLGIAPSTLFLKVKEYGLKPPGRD